MSPQQAILSTNSLITSDGSKAVKKAYTKKLIPSVPVKNMSSHKKLGPKERYKEILAAKVKENASLTSMILTPR